MKNKNTIIISLFILLLSYSSCDWNEWFVKPTYPRGDLYMPDSLKFQQNTGDTAIFICSKSDTIMYDTFRIKNYSYMSPLVGTEDEGQIGTYEINYISYSKNEENKMSLGIKYWDTGNIVFYAYHCDTYTINDSIISNFTIEEISYNNIIYNLGCEDSEIKHIYRNKNNGLISYTINSNTFNLYKYIPIK